MSLRKFLARRFDKEAYSSALTVNMLFLPGVFLVVGGVMALLAPKILLGILAAFLIFLGLSLSFLAWKVLQFKRKVESVIRGLEGRIVIDAQAIDEILEEQLRAESKKVTFH